MDPTIIKQDDCDLTPGELHYLRKRTGKRVIAAGFYFAVIVAIVVIVNYRVLRSHLDPAVIIPLVLLDLLLIAVAYLLLAPLLHGRIRKIEIIRFNGAYSNQPAGRLGLSHFIGAEDVILPPNWKGWTEWEAGRHVAAKCARINGGNLYLLEVDGKSPIPIPTKPEGE